MLNQIRKQPEEFGQNTHDKIIHYITVMLDKILYPSLYSLQNNYEQGYVPGKKFTRLVSKLSGKQLADLLYDKINGNKLIMKDNGALPIDQKKQSWINKLQDSIEEKAYSENH